MHESPLLRIPKINGFCLECHFLLKKNVGLKQDKASLNTLYIFAGGSTINVNLRNEVLNTYGYLNGNYQRAERVNGMPSWKNDLYAIWYIQSRDATGNLIQSGNHWRIGALSEIGNNLSWIKASNDFSGITDNENQWLYYCKNGNAWTSPSDPYDIQIACMNGKYYCS